MSFVFNDIPEDLKFFFIGMKEDTALEIFNSVTFHDSRFYMYLKIIDFLLDSPVEFSFSDMFKDFKSKTSAHLKNIFTLTDYTVPDLYFDVIKKFNLKLEEKKNA